MKTPVNPKVSVVIPTYDREDKVPHAIESVLAQTFTDREIIVVDDGSVDGTGHILKKLYGERIRYYRQPNQGVSVARNKGIQEARGEWIAFLDSDDLWEKEKLDWQFSALRQFAPQCGACYTDVSLFNHPETRTFFQMAADNYRHAVPFGENPEVMRLLVRPGGAGMVVSLSSLIARTDYVKQTKFDPILLYSQDSEFMFRLAMLTGFCYVNKPLVRFDRSPAELRHVGVSAAWNRMDFFLQDSQLRLEGLSRLGDDLPAHVRIIIREQLGLIHSGWANWYLEKGEYRNARRAATRAARTHLSVNLALKWLLLWLSPQLTLRIIRRLEESRRSVTRV